MYFSGVGSGSGLVQLAATKARIESDKIFFM
jgi:hypothetical protein